MPINRSEETPFGLQAESKHYFTNNYLTPNRLSSLGYQIELCLGLEGCRYLEVGIGAGLLGDILKKNGKVYTGIDNNMGLSPNVVGVLPQLPFKQNSFDVSMCFQVLEHIPKSLLQDSISELARMSTIGLVISVPNASEKDNAKRRIAKTVYKKFGIPKRWAPRSEPNDPQHFWELGRGLDVVKFIAIAENAGLNLKTEFRNPHNLYHHFFVFVK